MTRHRPILAVLTACAVLCAGCGASSATHSGARGAGGVSAADDGTTGTVTVPRAHPQAVEPVAGASTSSTPAGRTPRAASVSVSSSGDSALPQPASLTVVRHQLAQSGMTASTDQGTLTNGRLAIAPVSAPPQVQAVINAGNQIARLPYIWGGGHLTYEDSGYDCSGSISYVLAAAGLLDGTMTSGQLMSWGEPGPGKWITVFATGGHTFMYVAGLRFDTVALAETGSRWSDRSADEPDLSSFVERHPAGL